MKLIRPEKLNLMTHKELNEVWVQKVIADDPTILGLGDLILKDKERIQPKAGRLDILLQDTESKRRYEVEITSFERLENGLHRIGGWFHFKGRLLNERNCANPLPNGRNSIELTAIADNFEIGFTEDHTLTYFEEKRELIRVEFMTCIPWVIDKSLETPADERL